MLGCYPIHEGSIPSAPAIFCKVQPYLYEYGFARTTGLD
jgi:hypothetical protein